MRTVTYGGAVSLDGFLTGPDGAMDWLHFSPDVQQITSAYFKTVDTILMGRKTYAVAVAQRPPRKKARASAKTKAASAMHTYVFSRTLTEVDDPDVELVRDDAAGFVRRLKNQTGGDICLMGGGELAQTLFAAGLVDKVGLNIHPVLLGSGAPTFRDPGLRIPLQLTECRTIDGGCILATYDVVHS
jgi:dihydrofolate reductase